MFNFHWTNATLFYGLYKRVNSFWENTPLAAQGKPSPEELALLIGRSSSDWRRRSTMKKRSMPCGIW